MFTEIMIAPCGLDCSLCAHAQKEEDPCPGCNDDSEHKPYFCAELCQVVKCPRRVGEGYRYCDECPEFPCEPIQELESRYGSQYPLKESPVENLQLIRELGIEAFLARERERWTCQSCGGPVSVHTGTCGKCGKSAC